MSQSIHTAHVHDLDPETEIQDDRFAVVLEHVSDLLIVQGITITRPSLTSIYTRWYKRQKCSLDRHIHDSGLQHFPEQELVAYLLPKFLREDFLLRVKEQLLGIKNICPDMMSNSVPGRTMSEKLRAAQHGIAYVADELSQEPGGQDSVDFVKLIHETAAKAYSDSMIGQERGVGWLPTFQRVADNCVSQYSANLAKYFSTKITSFFSDPDVLDLILSPTKRSQVHALLIPFYNDIHQVFNCFGVGNKAIRACWDLVQNVFIFEFEQIIKDESPPVDDLQIGASKAYTADKNTKFLRDMKGNYGTAFIYIEDRVDSILFQFFRQSIANPKNHLLAFDKPRLEVLRNVFEKDVTAFRQELAEACTNVILRRKKESPDRDRIKNGILALREKALAI